MDQTTLGDLEYQVRHRQLDFLRASGLNLDASDPNDTRTTCPMCSRIAHIYEVPAGLNMPTWECEFCGQKGNTIEYAMNYYGFSRTQAIYDVCRKLKIRITKLDTIKDPAGKTRLKRLDLSKGSVRNKVLQVTNNDDLAKIFDTDGFFE